MGARTPRVRGDRPSWPIPRHLGMEAGDTFTRARCEESTRRFGTGYGDYPCVCELPHSRTRRRVAAATAVRLTGARRTVQGIVALFLHTPACSRFRGAHPRGTEAGPAGPADCADGDRSRAYIN